MMNDDFHDKINNLEKLARKASPGPWKLTPASDTVVLATSGRPICSSTHCTLNQPTLLDTAKGADNAAFIEAANPAMILETLAELERLRKLCELWKHDYEILAETCSGQKKELDKLKKEANWLAHKHAESCRGEDGCKDCPDPSGNGCLIMDAEKWRKAARKAVEETR